MDTLGDEMSHNARGTRLGVRELRATLAGSIRRAEAGERLVVTSGGRPIAQLAPLDSEASDLDGLLASGAVVAPRRRSSFRPPQPVPVWAGLRLDQVLRELRG
ncbi:MAG: type II toxin-antitoxin system prevent-host-death family antitoxin [Actinomycetota bacterium]